MLNAPPPSPTVSAPNTQSTQLLANPNTTSIQGLQQYQRMGMQAPGGLSVPGAQPSQFPVGGMSGGTPGLSANPMQQQNLQAIIAALQGQHR